jgi:lysophospholipase L1-like esterase
MKGEVAGPKRAVFWLVTLLGPPALVFLVLELALQLLLPREPSAAKRLSASEQVEVASVTDANTMGTVAASAFPELIYQLKPHRHWNLLGVDVRTNGHGFRGDDLAERKPEGTRRIVGLGDSVMFGWGVREEATYMARLQKALQVRPELGRVEVLNCAVPGYNAPQEAALLRLTCGAFAPDLILVGYTLNDGDPPIFEDPPATAGILGKSRLYQLGWDLWTARVPAPSLDAIRRERIRQGLEQIARFARSRGTPVAFLIYPQHLKQYDPEIPKQIAIALGFAYLDLYEGFTREYRERGLSRIEDVYLGPHDAHPNAEGHEMIAELLTPFVATLLGRSH